MKFNKPVLIYIPCYNCEKTIIDVLSNIPLELHKQIECLVVDNRSVDSTLGLVLHEKNKYPFIIKIIRPTKNIGYAGSQKLTYHLAGNNSNVKSVIMLHGDGQYDPSLLKKMIPYINKGYAIVNGYRDKKKYPYLEQTPIVTYSLIKILSWFESIITGCRHEEWHSGFVMYDTEFMSQIPLQFLSSSMHIDGEFLLCAEILGKKTKSVPIYKRYKGYESFGGTQKIKHVFNVFKIILKYKNMYYHSILNSNTGCKIDYSFEIMA